MKRKSVFAKAILILQAAVLIGSMLVIVPFTGAAAAPTQNWKEGSDGVFYISNASDLLAFAQNAEANEWYNGKAVKLTADIDMSGVKWTPIAKFRGFFEGNGRIIKNLTLTSSTPRIAMFDTLDGATVRNLRLGATLTQTGTGGMAALLAVETVGQPVTVENVHISGTLTTPKVSTNYRVGGMIAHVAGNTVIKGCASEASIISGYKTNGGFVGANCFTSELELTDCVYYGTLSQTLDVETAGFVGRVIGRLKMTRCINLSYTRGGASQYQGALLYLDNKDFRTGGDTSALALLYPIHVTLEDCYTTLKSAGDIIVGTHTSRKMYNVTVRYDGKTVYSTGDFRADHKGITLACETLAVGSNVKMNKDNFREICPDYTSWVATNDTVTYGSSQKITLVLPRDINQLLAGTYTAGAIPTLTPYEEETTTAEETSTTAPESVTTAPSALDGTTDAADATTEVATGQTETPDAETGCGAAVGGSVGAILATAGCAMLKSRKKERE